MSAMFDLLAECQAKGIQLLPADNGGLTVDAPRVVLTPDLMEQLKVHKPELVAILRNEGDVPVADMTEPVADQRDDNRFEEWIELRRPDGGMSWVHPHHSGDDRGEIEPPDPCPKCGSLELWESAPGDLFRLTPGTWRCVRCDPPTKSYKLLRLAKRLKNEPTQWRVPRNQNQKRLS